MDAAYMAYRELRIKDGSLTPQIAETQYWVIFLRKLQNLVYRNAVLCYNITRYLGGPYGETKQG